MSKYMAYDVTNACGEFMHRSGYLKYAKQWITTTRKEYARRGQYPLPRFTITPVPWPDSDGS